MIAAGVDSSLVTSRSNRAAFSPVEIRLQSVIARGSFALLDPGFYLGQVPHDATRSQIEAAREFAAALHFVDGRFC
jgi:hypothetical protein